MKLINQIKAKLKAKKRKALEKRFKKQTKHFALDKYLSKAGFSVQSHLLSRGLFKAGLVINLIISIYLLLFFATKQGYTLPYIILILFVVWTLAFFLFLALIWVGFYLFLDLRIFKRKLSMEEVLPDFLFLTATNIRSGMTADKALWFAVRPRFGVLAKEIETVAKEVMSGVELTDSLEMFADKYESDILKRSINLLVEGIKSGGEIGDLLNRIAANIQESRIMRKEMAADVTTYVIFITFAAVVAAPVLLALSSQLIMIIGSIVSKVDVPASGNMMFAITGISVTPGDFRIFAFTSLSITAFFSSIIVATIKKGTIKEGIKYIPLFMIVSILFFLIASAFLGSILGGMFL
ncbi:type II secretion system F family protein [Candidatus Woesearchaeota archaeon]|nr:type II secretion system F family protein [Candidatus Woesearchaeota archaeon]